MVSREASIRTGVAIPDKEKLTPETKTGTSPGGPGRHKPKAPPSAPPRKKKPREPGGR